MEFAGSARPISRARTKLFALPSGRGLALNTDMRPPVPLALKYSRLPLTAAIPFLIAASLLAKTVSLAPSDNHASICLVPGDTLVVSLPSPITPTYRWQEHLPKPSPLSAMHDDYTPPKDAKGSGTQTFRFNAATVGKATVTLNFTRQQPGPAPEVTQTFSVDVAVASGEPRAAVLIGLYKGTLPCADCSGLQTELRLYARGKNDFTDTIYVNTRSYLGARGGDLSYTDRGEWAVLKGDAINANATVYALNPDHPEQEQFLLLQPGGGALTQLDRQMKPIDAPPSMNMTLKRVE